MRTKLLTVRVPLPIYQKLKARLALLNKSVQKWGMEKVTKEVGK